MVPHRDPILWLAVLSGPFGAALWLQITGSHLEGSPELSLASLVILVAAVPVVEEWFFRGLLQGYLLRRYWGGMHLGPLSLANAMTAALFAASHWPRGGMVLAAGVLLPGLLFGFFRERHDGLISPVILHAWYNTCVISMSYLK
ncbi:JDVT-CTERM system glutamic-type intramembrane protease MrtJ [Halorhodospira halochloris]|uniref:JDVT-CTERM system glutamic-type intramembrane protease MrtJ n=1 Tax=Halorhodospira halochloris TaxID=1052 RepID=UPI003B75B915